MLPKLFVYVNLKQKGGSWQLTGGCKEPQRKRQCLTKEEQPVAYHGKSTPVYEELLHSMRCKAVIDLAPGDDLFGTACLLNRIPIPGWRLL